MLSRIFIIISTLALWLTNTASAQTKIVTYHDPSRSQIKETYSILGSDSSQVDGPYVKYYPDGAVALKGSFVKGQKVGQFQEFYPNGIKKRLLHFENGLKNGEITVWDKAGNIIQKGQYLNDTLNNTLVVYYDNGQTKSETSFAGGKA